MSGPAPGSQCHACRHQNVALINAALAAGQSGRKVAQKFGLGKDSVLRHVAARHEGVVVPSKDKPAAAGVGGSVSETSSELDRLNVMRSQLEGEMSRFARSDTARELRQVIARIAELSGDDRPKSVTVADVEGFAEQVAAWFVVLEAYPEARAAMLAATVRSQT